MIQRPSGGKLDIGKMIQIHLEDGIDILAESKMHNAHSEVRIHIYDKLNNQYT